MPVAAKSVEEFKILSAREHVRSRMGLYLGSSSREDVERFVGGVWKRVTYVPAINKIIDEIIDNSIDEAIRTKFTFADKIDVTIEGDTVTVTDNGRGIPQEMVVTPEGEKISRPVAAWTRVNAGTSFTEDRVSIGANGVGSSCTNFVSASFIGRTWSNGSLLEVVCSDGCNNVDVKNKKRSGSGTQVAFTPDFSLFEVDSLQSLDTVALVEDRLVSLQLAFPEIRFSFNGARIQITDLKKYSHLFTPQHSSVIIEKTDDLAFFFTASEDGFRSNSFVNGVNTRQGGAYVDYIVNGVIDELSTMIKRKHKVEIAKSTLKNGLTFVLFARNFNNPKFDSQTKERLTNSVGDVRNHATRSGIKDFKTLAKKLFAADDIIDPIIASHLAKKEQQDRREALQAQKKLKKVKVAKHISASSPDATLFLTEGQSASGFCIKVRNPALHGMYPLRGKVMNIWDMKAPEVLKNKELSELIAVLGLDINDPDSVDDMQYRYVATLTDADMDGLGHIAPLLVTFFYKYWPRLFQEGRVRVIRTPIMISTKGSSVQWFYSYEEADTFKRTSVGYNHRYIKGLGSLEESEYAVILNDPTMDIITIDDAQMFEMMFGEESELRKNFMMAA
jgi:DNA gyrase/topoisomerase IV subunit B